MLQNVIHRNTKKASSDQVNQSKKSVVTRQSILCQLAKIKYSIPTHVVQLTNNDELNGELEIAKTIKSILRNTNEQLICSGQIIQLYARIQIKENEMTSLGQLILRHKLVDLQLFNEIENLETLTQEQEYNGTSQSIDFPFSISEFQWIKSIHQPSRNTFLIYGVILILLEMDLIWDKMRTLNLKQFNKLKNMEYKDLTEQTIDKLQTIKFILDECDIRRKTQTFKNVYSWISELIRNQYYHKTILATQIKVKSLQTEFDTLNQNHISVKTRAEEIYQEITKVDRKQLVCISQRYQQLISQNRELSQEQADILNLILNEIENKTEVSKLTNECESLYHNLQQFRLSVIYSKEWLEAIIEMQPQSKQQPIQFKMFETLQDPYLYSSILLVKGVGDLKIEQLNQQMNKIINRQIAAFLVDYYLLMPKSTIEPEVLQLFSSNQHSELTRIFYLIQKNNHIDKMLVDNKYIVLIKVHKQFLKHNVLKYNNTFDQFEYCDNRIRQLVGKVIRSRTGKEVIKFIKEIQNYSGLNCDHNLIVGLDNYE